MQSIDNEHLPTDVKQRIENILAKHKISTGSTIQNPITNSFNALNSALQNTTTSYVPKEIKLDPSKTIMSKTNRKGIIEYANDYFMEISGYEEYELMGQPHNIIRHPDMPKVIFKELWARLNKGENIYALVKNKAKNGDYYWVLTSFETRYNENGEIISHYAHRKAAPANAVYQIEKIYKTLLSIEKNQSIAVSEKYFEGLLEEKNMNYDAFILDLLGINQQSIASYFVNENKPANSPKKKGVFKRLFSN